MNTFFMSDDALDKAWYAAKLAGDQPLKHELEMVILDRLDSVTQFLGSAFGDNDFPLYSANGGFNSVDAAQGAIKENAAELAGDIKGFVFPAVLGVAVFAVVAGGVYLYFTRKAKA